MESTNVIKNFICEICEKAFSNKYCRDQHISTVHGEVKRFDCNVCSKPFGQNYQLMRHIENNHKVKDQKCKFCAKRFPNFGRMGKHHKYSSNPC